MFFTFFYCLVLLLRKKPSRINIDSLSRRREKRNVFSWKTGGQENIEAQSSKIQEIWKECASWNLLVPHGVRLYVPLIKRRKALRRWKGNKRQETCEAAGAELTNQVTREGTASCWMSPPRFRIDSVIMNLFQPQCCEEAKQLCRKTKVNFTAYLQLTGQPTSLDAFKDDSFSLFCHISFVYYGSRWFWWNPFSQAPPLKN